MLSTEANLILRCTVGSTVYGLALEGTDDRDEMGIMLEPPSYITGLQEARTIVERTKPEGVRSGPGDLDLVIHPLQKWVALAVKGNPTVLTPLFAPHHQCQVMTARGNELRSMRKWIISKKAGYAFLGYLASQKLKFMGLRGQVGVKRPELVEKYGYDTKYAMHALRLGYQGIQLMNEGQISLPMRPLERALLMDVRRGVPKKDEVLKMIEALEVELRQAVEKTHLQDSADMHIINNFLHETYMREWPMLRTRSLGNV